MNLNYITTDKLKIAYAEIGSTHGWPCILCHGFPYDIHAYLESAKYLAKNGARVIIPYMRGFGGTTFLSSKTRRSGQQAAIGADLLALMDCLNIDKAVLGGYDWGGRAACIVSALYPERVMALISGGDDYNIQNIANSQNPLPANEEAALWYQYYFHSERGKKGLQQNRRDIARLLWHMWSPTWHFNDTEFNKTAISFDNADFVEVVLHSYRHRYGLVSGDPDYDAIERKLALQPPINVTTITIYGDKDGVSFINNNPSHNFTGYHTHRIFAGTGHNLAQERPQLWANTVIDAYNLTLGLA